MYAFDLMVWRGRDIREQPLVQHRAQLEAILKRGVSRLIRFNESFPHANALLVECARRGLEGIVSKRRDAPYRSGTLSGWIKVKTQEWKEANRYRAKLLERRLPEGLSPSAQSHCRLDVEECHPGRQIIAPCREPRSSKYCKWTRIRSAC